jgi:uncharacterized protein YqjF (DUF2071 family)
MITVTWTVDPTMVRSFVPRGTEIDVLEGHPLISLVASHVTNVRWRGRAVPFVGGYNELRLQTYVREQRAGQDARRGIVVIDPIVSKRLVATATRVALGESYRFRKMRHVAVPDVDPATLAADAQRSVVYEWYRHKEWERMVALTVGAPRAMRRDSVEEFVTERQWGFSRIGSQPTRAYFIDHPRWHISLLADCLFEVDLETLYGPRFTDALSGEPASSVAVAGSTVHVYPPVPLNVPS